MTTAQAAALVGASEQAIREAVSTGHLHPARVRFGRALRFEFEEQELRAWAATRRPPYERQHGSRAYGPCGDAEQRALDASEAGAAAMDAAIDCRQLWAAVLRRALLDAAGDRPDHVEGGPSTIETGLALLTQECGPYADAREAICSVLDLDPERVRRLATAAIEAERARIAERRERERERAEQAQETDDAE